MMKKLFFLIILVLFFIPNMHAEETVSHSKGSVKEGKIDLGKVPENIKQQLEEPQTENETNDVDKIETEEEFEKYGYYTHKDKVFSKLPIFGNDIFKKDSFGFSASGSISIPYNYILGPGDKLKIHIWGNKEKLYKVDVNYEGEIFIPQLGTIFVQAKPLSE